MASIESTNTLTADGTLQSVVATAANGVYIVRVDLSQMAGGDTTRIFCALNVDEGGGGSYQPIITHDQVGVYNDGSDGAPAILELGPLVSVSTSSLGTVRLFIKQTAGTNRDYFWQLVKVV